MCERVLRPIKRARQWQIRRTRRPEDRRRFRKEKEEPLWCIFAYVKTGRNRSRTTSGTACIIISAVNSTTLEHAVPPPKPLWTGNRVYEYGVTTTECARCNRIGKIAAAHVYGVRTGARPIDTRLLYGMAFAIYIIDSSRPKSNFSRKRQLISLTQHYRVHSASRQMQRKRKRVKCTFCARKQFVNVAPNSTLL